MRDTTPFTTATGHLENGEHALPINNRPPRTPDSGTSSLLISTSGRERARPLQPPLAGQLLEGVPQPDLGQLAVKFDLDGTASARQ